VTRPVATGSGTRAEPTSEAFPPGQDVATTELEAATPLGWFVAVAAFLLCVVDLPEISSGVWAPKLAVLIVLGAAGFPVLLYRAFGGGPAGSGTPCWAARAAVTFVVAATVSTLLAPSPMSALVGHYDQGTGLVFVVAVAGCWAIGTLLGHGDRRILVTALIVGALANSLAAIFEQVVGLSSVGVPNYDGIPTGLQGNPIYFAALLVGTLALVAERVHVRADRWWACVAVLGIALGVSGERLPALVALAVVAFELWRARRADGPGSRRASYLFGALAVGGILVGVLLAKLRNGGGLGARLASSTTNETFGQRLAVWKAGLEAIAHRPLFGYGPGQFEAATQARFSATFLHQNPGAVFSDSHNFLIEYAATTGLIGVAMLCSWIVLALWGRRGPLVVFAVALLACGLAEPLNVAITPLALLALGASAFTGQRGPSVRPRVLTVAVIVVGVVALIPACTLVVGDALLQRANSEYSVAQIAPALSDATAANRLLAPLPDPAELLSQIQNYRALDFQPGALGAAVHWASVAAQRAPTDPLNWVGLANAQLRARQLNAARASALEAVMLTPLNEPANSILGNIALWEHRPAEARRYFARSLSVDPDQPLLKAEEQGRCVPIPPWRRGFSRSCALASG